MNKFIVSERQYIGITATINGFRSTLASCEEYIDGRTGEPFAPTEAQSDVEEHKLQGVLIRRILRVNCFMLLARVAQYWLMDFYSRVLDQRMSIIGKMRNRIMMGQARQYLMI